MFGKMGVFSVTCLPNDLLWMVSNGCYGDMATPTCQLSNTEHYMFVFFVPHSPLCLAHIHHSGQTGEAESHGLQIKAY